MIPFAAATLFAWGVSSIPLPEVFFGAIAYGAVVLSFMGGLRGGIGIVQDSRDAAMSVAPPLAGWIAILSPPLIGLCLLIAAFFLQAFWNVVSAERGTLPLWFGKFSSLFTSGAVIALLAMLIRLLT